MKKLVTIATFIAGAVVGSGVTWLCVRKKYKELDQERERLNQLAYERVVEMNAAKEEESVDEYEEFDEDETVDEEDEEIDDEEYFIREESSDYDEIIETEEYGGVIMTHQAYDNKPYVIRPDEFGEDGYETEGASYYADSRLTNDRGVLLDVDETIGQRNLSYFGEYEEDVLYVRNPLTKTDYEVYLDPRKYSEVYPGRA